MFSRFNAEGSRSPGANDSNPGSNLNSRAASFLKMAASQAQQFANNNSFDTASSTLNSKQQDSTKKITDELAANDKLLHMKTPDVEAMTQPEDETGELIATPLGATATAAATAASTSTSTSIPSSSTPTPVPTSAAEDTREATPLSSTDPANIVSGVDITKLTPDVRSKIKKFAKYEQKYPVLLDAYRTEKLKNSLLESFEKLLREYTPCASISESQVLFQYIGDLKQKNDLTNDELKRIVAEANNVKSKLNSLEAENNKYQTIFKNMQKNESLLRARDAELEAKSKELDSKIQEIEKLRVSTSNELDEIAKLQTQVRERDEKIVELENKAAEAASETEEKLKQLEIELEQKPNVVAESDAPQAEVEEQPLSKSAKKRNKKKNKNAKQQDAVKETETVETIAETNDNTEALIEEKQKELAAKTEEITALKQEIAGHKEEIEHLKDSLRDVGNELVEIKHGEQSEKTLHLQHTEAITKYEMAAKSLKDEIARLQKTIAKLEMDNEVHQGENAILTKQVGELQKVKDDDINLKLELNNLRKSLEAKEKLQNEANSKIGFLEEEKNAINEKYIEAKITIENIKGEIKRSNEQSNKWMTENESLKEEIKKFNLKLGKLNNENSILLRDRDEYKDKLMDLSQLKSSNSDQVENMMKVNDELNMRLREATTAIESAQEELNDSRTMLQERTRETSTIRKLLVELEEEKQKIMREFEFKLAQKVDEIDKLNFEINKLNKKSKLELNELQVKLKNYEDELANGATREVVTVPVSSTNGVDNSKEELLNNKIAALQTQLDITDSRLKEYENMNQILKKLNDEMSLKFEKMNKNFRLQQFELKKQRHDSMDLQRRLSSSSSIPSVASVPSNNNAKKDEDEEEKVSYIKNVLIGFIEKKEQRMNLLPVIKMMLKLDDKDVDILTNNLK